MFSDMTTNAFVSAYLKDEMQARGITQKDLQKVIGRKSQSYVSDRLNNKSDWALDDLDSIARYLGRSNAVSLIIDAYSRHYSEQEQGKDTESIRSHELEEKARNGLTLAAYDVGEDRKRHDILGDAYGQEADDGDI